MDDSAAHVVEQLLAIAAESRTECVVVGLAGPTATTLDTMGALGRVPANQVVGTVDEAREVAKGLLSAATPLGG